MSRGVSYHLPVLIAYSSLLSWLKANDPRCASSFVDHHRTLKYNDDASHLFAHSCVAIYILSHQPDINAMQFESGITESLIHPRAIQPGLAGCVRPVRAQPPYAA